MGVQEGGFSGGIGREVSREQLQPSRMIGELLLPRGAWRPAAPAVATVGGPSGSGTGGGDQNTLRPSPPPSGATQEHPKINPGATQN